MPKLKTHRGAAKRFKRTGSGKLKRSRAYKSHMMASKSQDRVRRHRLSQRAEPLDVGIEDGGLAGVGL